jgi:tripartite ATP-independent transporter DctM subunit
MSIELITVLMFGGLLVFLILGMPVAFATGALAVLFIFFLWSPEALVVVAVRTFGQMYQYLLFAIPLFIFLASILEKAGIIEDMFITFREWTGPLGGGLAIACVLVGTLLAAVVGVIGAAVVTMGIIGLPAMLKRKYNKGIALGSIMAGGTLGILIPPSVLFILYSLVAGESCGKLFIGGILPGLVLSALFCLYIAIRCWRNPALGPPLSKEEIAELTWKRKLIDLKGIGFPIGIIIAVFGAIFTGVASITEAAGVGAFLACVCAATKRQLTWKNFTAASHQTVIATCMVMWTIFGAQAFVTFYIAVGGGDFIAELVLGTGLGPYGVLALIMGILIFLGCFLDWVGIMMLCVPIFLPIIKILGFDPLWFGIIYNVNMQMSFLSPPFGYALFYMKGVAPPDISMEDIIKAAIPFLGLQFLGLIICIKWPIICLYLPNLIFVGFK